MKYCTLAFQNQRYQLQGVYYADVQDEIFAITKIPVGEQIMTTLRCDRIIEPQELMPNTSIINVHTSAEYMQNLLMAAEELFEEDESEREYDYFFQRYEDDDSDDYSSSST